jgi:uncharacterized membrane protein YphA (DoxX/SURF4 family)
MTIYTLFGMIGAIALAVTLIRFFVQRPMNLFLGYVQDFVGVLFIFSGFVKAIDPLGTSYKMTEYFHEFNMMFMDPFALSFAIFMIVLELVLGVTLLLGYKKDITVWLLLLMILFFTFLTGFTAYTDKVTDCGCFGDFIKLKPIQSFYKDLILTVLILILFFMRKNIEPLLSNHLAVPVVVLVTLFSTWYNFRNFYFNEPQFDFRPYAVGNHIPDLMKVPKGKEPIVERIFVYANSSNPKEKIEITQDDLMAGKLEVKYDLFIERKEKVIKEGETPRINNFRIDNENGENISEDLLNDPNYAFWVIAYDLDKTCKHSFTDKLNAMAEKAEQAGYKFFVATSTRPEKFRHDVQAAYPFYTADGIFLKTIVRSNPGLLIVKNGTVMAKYHHKHFPSFEEIQQTVLK